MNPLVHDAKRLLCLGEGHEPFALRKQKGEYVDEFWFCGGWIERPKTGSAIGHHEEPCPWRSAPKLLEIIKAAEAVVESAKEHGDGEAGSYELIMLARALRGDA